MSKPIITHPFTASAVSNVGVETTPQSDTSQFSQQYQSKLQQMVTHIIQKSFSNQKFQNELAKNRLAPGQHQLSFTLDARSITFYWSDSQKPDGHKLYSKSKCKNTLEKINQLYQAFLKQSAVSAPATPLSSAPSQPPSAASATPPPAEAAPSPAPEPVVTPATAAAIPVADTTQSALEAPIPPLDPLPATPLPSTHQSDNSAPTGDAFPVSFVVDFEAEPNPKSAAPAQPQPVATAAIAATSVAATTLPAPEAIAPPPLPSPVPPLPEASPIPLNPAALTTTPSTEATPSSFVPTNEHNPFLPLKHQLEYVQQPTGFAEAESSGSPSQDRPPAEQQPVVIIPPEAIAAISQRVTITPPAPAAPTPIPPPATTLTRESTALVQPQPAAPHPTPAPSSVAAIASSSTSTSHILPSAMRQTSRSMPPALPAFVNSCYEIHDPGLKEHYVLQHQAPTPLSRSASSFTQPNPATAAAPVDEPNQPSVIIQSEPTLEEPSEVSDFNTHLVFADNPAIHQRNRLQQAQTLQPQPSHRDKIFAEVDRLLSEPIDEALAEGIAARSAVEALLDEHPNQAIAATLPLPVASASSSSSLPVRPPSPMFDVARLPTEIASELHQHRTSITACKYMLSQNPNNLDAQNELNRIAELLRNETQAVNQILGDYSNQPKLQELVRKEIREIKALFPQTSAMVALVSSRSSSPQPSSIFATTPGPVIAAAPAASSSASASASASALVSPTPSPATSTSAPASHVARPPNRRVLTPTRRQELFKDAPAPTPARVISSSSSSSAAAAAAAAEAETARSFEELFRPLVLEPATPTPLPEEVADELLAQKIAKQIRLWHLQQNKNDIKAKQRLEEVIANLQNEEAVLNELLGHYPNQLHWRELARNRIREIQKLDQATYIEPLIRQGETAEKQLQALKNERDALVAKMEADRNR